MDILCLTYLHGFASEKVWQHFATQGIFFRRVAVWDSTGFFDEATEKKQAQIRTEKPDRIRIDGMEELLVVPKRWPWRNLITGFEDLSEEEFDNLVKEFPRTKYGLKRKVLEKFFDIMLDNDPSWKAPRLRMGVFF
jgi:hypothetical protein